MRTVPPALQAHLDQPVTTTCRLLRIQLRDGRMFGVTSLDADVTYNDGRGVLTYSANQGIDPSTLAADSDLSVANAEAQSLLVTTGTGITEAMIEAGDLRDAEWTLYLVNYLGLGMGHTILGAGDVGEITKRWGMVWMPELLSYSVRLRQPIGTHWSRTCRAIFGAPAQGQTGCGINLATLWVAGVVVSAGLESDRQFTSGVVGTFVPGRVEFTGGPNIGRVGIVDSVDAGVVTLANAMPFAIAAGHAFRIRADCARTWAACVGYSNQANYKGEPLIPTGDAASVSTPGAQVTRGSVGTEVADGSSGTGPAAPAQPAPLPVSLVNSDFNAASGGWVVRRQDATPGFSIHTAAPGFSYDPAATPPKSTGVLRWQATGALPFSGFDFGDRYENTSTGQGTGGLLSAEMWVRCAAITGVTVTDFALAFLGVQAYQDAACTIPIGGIGGGAQAEFREVGGWRVINFSALPTRAGEFFRLVVVPMTAVPVTLEFDTASWTADPDGWVTRGQR